MAIDAPHRVLRRLGNWELTTKIGEGFALQDATNGQRVCAEAYLAFNHLAGSAAARPRAIVWTADHPAVKARLQAEEATLRALWDLDSRPAPRLGYAPCPELLDGNPKDGWIAVEELQTTPLPEIAVTVLSAGRPIPPEVLGRFSRGLWRTLRSLAQSKENRHVHWSPTPDRIHLAPIGDSWDWDKPVLDQFCEYAPLDGVAANQATVLGRPYMPETKKMSPGAMTRYWAEAVMCLAGGVPTEHLGTVWVWANADGDRLPLDTVPPGLRRTLRSVVAPTGVLRADPRNWVRTIDREIREDAGTKADARSDLDSAVLDFTNEAVRCITDNLPRDQVKKVLITATDNIATAAATSGNADRSSYEIDAAIKLLHSQLELHELKKTYVGIENSSEESADLLSALRDKTQEADKLQMDNAHLIEQLDTQLATIELLQEGGVLGGVQTGITNEMFDDRMIDITSMLNGPLYQEAN